MTYYVHVLLCNETKHVYVLMLRRFCNEVKISNDFNFYVHLDTISHFPVIIHWQFDNSVCCTV